MVNVFWTDQLKLHTDYIKVFCTDLLNEVGLNTDFNIQCLFYSGASLDFLDNSQKLDFYTAVSQFKVYDLGKKTHTKNIITKENLNILQLPKMYEDYVFIWCTRTLR